LIVCHKLLGRPFTEKEENELSRTRRRWRPKEMVLGWECRGPLLVGVSGVAVQTIRTPARLSLSQQPSSF
jgi:hypothetical protein